MLNYEYPPLGGGASPVTRDLAITIETETEWTVDVVTMRYGDLPATDDDDGVTVHRVPSLRTKKEMANIAEMASYLPSGVAKCIQLAHHHNYDVVHSHFVIPTGVVGSIIGEFFGLPHIITSHGSDVPGYNPDHYIRAHDLLKPATKRIVQASDTVVTPSKYLKDLIVQEYSPDSSNLFVVPYGFDPDQIRPAETKENRILMASRLLERKGFQYVIRALSQLETEYDVRVAGEGPYKSDLVALADQLGVDVTFLGWLEGDALTEEYARSSIFVLPSASDNYPVALLEAMAAGNAVITSNVSGCPEVVGDTGVLVEPKSVQQIREAIGDLVSDTERMQRLQTMARTRIEEELSWSNIASQYTQMYKHAKVQRESGQP